MTTQFDNPAATIEAWQATRVWAANIETALGFDPGIGDGYAGYVYSHGWIGQEKDGSFFVIIENREWKDTDLAALEAILWREWVDTPECRDVVAVMHEVARD